MKRFFLATILVAMACGCGKKTVGKALTTDENATGCAVALNRIYLAKETWAQKLNRGPDDTPTMDDLTPYLRHVPACPGGGTYTLGKVSEKPTCSIAEHNAAFEKFLKDQAQAPAQ